VISSKFSLKMILHSVNMVHGSQYSLRDILWVGFIFILFWRPGNCQVAITQRFDVFLGPVAQGGCDAAHLAQLNGIWSDCWDMVNAAIRLMDAATGTAQVSQAEQTQAEQLGVTFMGATAQTPFNLGDARGILF
jgi:hypothetical protein